MAAAGSTADAWPLCGPCGDFPPRHDECQGAAVLCECLTEVLLEAEDADRSTAPSPNPAAEGGTR